MAKPEPVVAHPAATVVLLRDAEAGCEVLLVQRNARLSFHGGAWVFPGGRIDPADRAAGADDIAAARVAAVREAREEAGVTISPDQLVLFSRWVTPVEVPKRFDTWFFAAACEGSRIQVDGGEIHAYRWLSPAAALAAQQVGDIDLPPPTFVTLMQLADLGGAGATLAALRQGGIETFLPRLATAADAPCTLYHGDAGYEAGDPTTPGARHRLLMLPSGWRYERSLE